MIGVFTSFKSAQYHQVTDFTCRHGFCNLKQRKIYIEDVRCTCKSKVRLKLNQIWKSYHNYLPNAGRFLLPALDFGTVYLLTSGLPHHSQHFVGSGKLINFGNLTQILCYNYVAIVVLEVTFT